MDEENPIYSIHNLGEPTVLTVGVPFARGRLVDANVAAYIDGEPVPLWRQPRSRWPDGSVRWLWIHVRVPAGACELELRPSEPGPDATSPRVHETDDAWRVDLDGARLEIRRDGAFRFETDALSWECREAEMRFRPPLGRADDPVQVDLIEPSPFAPLLRFRKRFAQDAGLECLLRLIPVSKELLVWRRVTLLAAGKRLLDFMGLELRHSRAATWQAPGWAAGGRFRLTVLQPGKFMLNDAEGDGFPELLLRGEGGSLYLEKGWQRFPAGVAVDEGACELLLFPEEAPGLTLWPGTSLRHRFRLTLGAPASPDAPGGVRWRLDPEYFAGTGVFGPLVPSTDETARLFPGYELGFRTAFADIRRTRLDEEMNGPMGPPAPLDREELQAPEYFGLQHYGDWPLELGRYAGGEPDHRGYADNEYDMPFGFLQQFARTGDWSCYDASREGAVHMADIDMDVTTPGMFFHGYRVECEDHDRHRARPAVGDHSWTDGLWGGYFLSGDVWAREAAELIGRVLLDKFADAGFDTLLREWSHCERAIGWPMVQLCANVEARGDQGEMRICHAMAEFLYEAMREPDSFVQRNRTMDGAPFKWWRTGGVDGSKTFMLGVCLEGLERYHRLSQDAVALKAMKGIADFLLTEMWNPNTGMFTYERNSYLPQHRRQTPSCALLAVSGLAYLYEQTRDERCRDVARTAFFASQWVFVSPVNAHDVLALGATNITSARELGQFTRSSNAMAHWLLKWHREREAQLAAAPDVPARQDLQFSGTPREFMDLPMYQHRRGAPELLDDGALYAKPRFSKDAALVEDGSSFIEGGFRDPVAADRGRIEITLAPGSSDFLKGGVCQRGWLYLSDSALNASALSLMSFYDQLSLRLYDAGGRLITSVEASMRDWPAKEVRKIGVEWSPKHVALSVDGSIAGRSHLPRPLGGVFRRILIGAHPLHWTAEGIIHALSLRCVRSESGGSAET